MRIAFDHQIFAQQRFGGISRYFVELAARLPACGEFAVTVVAPFHQNEHLARAALPGARTLAKLSPGRISIKGLLRWSNGLALPFAWRGGPWDIVHETYFSPRPWGRSRARVVTVYDMIHELFPGRLGKSDETMAAKRAAVARADHVICISETTRRDLVRLLAVDPAKTSVVYLGHTLATEAEALPGAEDSDLAPAPRLLYVGDRGSYKNFDTLAVAFAASARLRREFRLVAFGGKPFAAREIERLRALGIAERVTHEAGDDARLAAAYRSARLFVCPSTYEGFGLPPLEAMSHGCPVACSNRGSLPEIVGDAGEYFDPTEPPALAAALERVAFDDTRRRELIARGRARAAQFTWSRCATETAAVYRRLG